MREVDRVRSTKISRLNSRIMTSCFLSIGTVTVAALLLAAALNGKYMHDEESYITGAFFASDYALYGDFVFLQPPYFAWVFGAVFKLVDSNFFLTARLVVFVLSFSSAAMAYLLARRISGSTLIGACAAALFMFSTVLIPAFGWARNDILAIFFSLAAMLAFVAADRTDARYAALLKVIAGVAAGCAVGTKVSYVFLPAGMFMIEAARYVLQHGRENSVKKLAGLSAGLMLAVIPILLVAALYPGSFFYGVYEHHIIAPPDWSSQLGRPGRSNVRAAILSWLSFIRQDVSMGALVFLGYGVLHTLSNNSKRFKEEYSINGDKAFFLLLIALAIPLTLATRPVHIHYVQPLIPLLIMAAVAHTGAAGVVAALPERLFRQRFFAIMTVLVCIPGFAILLNTALGNSGVERMSRVSEEIRVALGDIRGPVASVSPIRVIEAGGQPYTEFSAGPFFYRTAHLLPASRVRALGGVSPETLTSLFTEKPPNAILVGYEDNAVDIDSELKKYAEASEFDRIEIDNGNASLYLRRNR